MNPSLYNEKFQEIYTELEVVNDQMEDNLTNNVVKLDDLDQIDPEEFKSKKSEFKYKDLCLKITIVSTAAVVLGGLILIFILSDLYGKQENPKQIQ